MILHLLLLSFFNLATGSEFCIESSCSGDHQTIRFPFKIENHHPKPCGYPGFDLSCHATGPPQLHLPHSGNFSVQNIDYEKQEIRINDPDECLPRKILSLNLSGSPFLGKNDRNVTFFNCSSYYYPPYLYSIDQIHCLSSSSHTVFAASSPMFMESLYLNCVVIKTVSVPFSSYYSSMIWNDGLLLRWKNPDCGSCESLGRRCEMKPNSSHDVQCTNISQGSSRGATNVVAIAMGGIFICFFLLGLLCCFCIKVNLQSRINNSSILAYWTGSSQPTNNMGLDGPTIDSFPKFELDESLCLPKPNDNICPICLAHYRPREIVKSIPNCQHCFHQRCIDQWLRLNASCPVCRKSHIQSPPSNPS